MKGVWTSLRGLLADRREDERGATFILTAVCMVVLLWGGAVGVDLGLTVATNRQAQAIADTAALDMTRHIDIADALTSSSASQSYLSGLLNQANTDNGTNAGLSYVPGYWTGTAFDQNGITGQGCYTYFPPASKPCNAVKVTAKVGVPQVFIAGTGSVSRTSIAAVTPEATFSIGTYLANVSTTQSPILNAILGGLGSSVSISAADYDGMANTWVSIGQLIAASAGYLTDSNVMTASLSPQQWLSIWRTAVGNQAGTCSTQTPACETQAALTSTVFNGTATAELCQLVNITTSSSTNGTNAYGCSSATTGNLSTSALSTQLDVLQTFETEAELANGSSAVNVGSISGIPNLVSASLTTDLISPPVVASGPTGTQAQTAQVQATLSLSINILGVPYTVAVAVTGAAGTAALQTLQCTNNALKEAFIQPEVTTLSASNSSVTVTGVAVPGSLSVTGYSGSTLGFEGPVVPPTATTAANGWNPDTAASSSPSVVVNSPTGTPAVLAPVLSALTDVLQPVFQAAGLTFGGATVADLATNCGGVSLVK